MRSEKIESLHIASHSVDLPPLEKHFGITN